MLTMIIVFVSNRNSSAEHQFAVVRVEQQVPQTTLTAKVAGARRVMIHVLSDLERVKYSVCDMKSETLLHERRKHAAPPHAQKLSAGAEREKDRTFQEQVTEMRKHRLSPMMMIRMQRQQRSRNPGGVLAQGSFQMVPGMTEVKQEVLTHIQSQPRGEFQRVGLND